MAVTAEATGPQQLIVDGMRAGGQHNIHSSSVAVSNFYKNQFETIKAELWAIAHTDPLLKTEVVLNTNVGAREVCPPSDFDTVASIWLFDGSDDYRGTCQSGSNPNSLKLPSTFSAHEDDLVGRYIFLISGTGSADARTIIAYDDSTKLVTPHSAFTVSPDTTTGYLISQYQCELKRRDNYQGYSARSKPYYYTFYNTPGTIYQTPMLFHVYPTPDKIYPIFLHYYANLTRLDDTSAMFIRHLRERRDLWLQGIKTYTMQAFDDDRYKDELIVWEAKKAIHASQCRQFERIEAHR